MLPREDWTPPRVQDLPSWRDAKRIAFDVETKDPDLKALGPGDFRPGNHIVGFSFAIEDGESHYLPIRHEGGGNMDVDQVLAYVRDQARDFRGVLCGANINYDLGFCRRDGIHFRQVAWYRDVINAAVLIYELYNQYNLDAIAERMGIPGKDRVVIEQFASAYKVDPIAELYKLPARAAARYALQDVRLPLTVLRRQEREIEALGIQGIWDLESQVLPALHEMRGRGVRVNLDKIRKVIEWATAQATDRLAFVKWQTGVEVRFDQVWEAGAMAAPIRAAGFEVPLNAPKGKKQKQDPSITGAFLDKCGGVGVALGRARDMSKLVQFANRTLRYQINGRVHCVLHQLRNTKEDGETKGARFGRMSAEHYNIQQEPGRDDVFGAMWRAIYEPEPGCFWVCSDWSQQEPRIAVHYAELLGLEGAHEFAERYRQDPRTDCHQLLADITGIVRKIVKNYFNASIYGIGDAKLCRAIGHPTVLANRYGKIIEVPGEDGQRIITQFKKMVPWVSQLTRHAAKRAETVGHVWTILRRRCNFPKDMHGAYDWTHKAFSRIGQGGAADQMKATLVAAHREGIPLQLAVHDEFDYSENDIKRAKRLKELQMDTVKFNVPMQVDLEIGPNWGNLQKLEQGEYFVDAMRRLVA